MSKTNTTGKKKRDDFDDAIEALLSDLESFEDSAEGWAYELRLDFADLLISGLRERRWSQTELAEKIDRKQPFVNRLIHADANCTLDTIGRLLHALGLKARLVREAKAGPAIEKSDTTANRVYYTKVNNHGEALQQDEEEIIYQPAARQEARQKPGKGIRTSVSSTDVT